MRQDIINRAGDVCGTEETTERTNDNYKGLGEKLPLVYQGRVKADSGFPLGELTVSPDRMTGKALDALPIGHSKTTFAERGNKDRVTCPALFCNGQKDVDGFQRSAALAYLTRRMLRDSGKSKGKAERELGEKTSSAMHLPTWFNAGNVEDIVQAAFILFWEAKKAGQEVSTRHCCKYALGMFVRGQRKQKNAILNYLETRQHTDARRETRLGTDKGTEELLQATREIGTGETQKLAEHFNVSRETMRKRLRKAEKCLA